VEPGIAAKTARERLERQRAKMLKHFDELPVSVRVANEIPVLDGAALEELAIACQENPRFASGTRRELIIGRIRGTGGVETDEAEASCEFGEMTIEDESDNRERTAPHVGQACDVDRVKSRKDSDPIRILHGAVERHRFAIHENQIDLGMRHAESLNQILHGSPTREAHGQGDVTLCGRQEVIQRTIDSDRSPIHGDWL
jgi:hypothetical protein